MITKAIIIDKDLDSNKYNVRVPYLETAGEKIIYFKATLSTLPGVSDAYAPGDVVLVGFEDHKPESPIILGKLFVDKEEDRGHHDIGSLNVSNKASLPRNTTIGGINVETIFKDFADNISEVTGENVEPNARIPAGASVTELNNLKIDNKYYSISGGGGGSETFVETILWISETPYSTFPNETVTNPIIISGLLDYDYIKVGWRAYASPGVVIQYTIVKVNRDRQSLFNLSCVDYYNEGGLMQSISRPGNTTVNPEGLTFGTAMKIQENTGETYLAPDNNFIIPVEVIGIKLGNIYQVSNPILLYQLDSSQSQHYENPSYKVLNLNDSLAKYKYLIINWRASRGDSSVIRSVIENKLYGAPESTADNCLFRLEYSWTEGGVSRYLKENGNFTSLRLHNCYFTQIGYNYTREDASDCTLDSIYGADTVSGGVVIDNSVLKAYPIGSIYMSVNPTNPHDLFGGTWERIEGKFLLGATGNTPESGTNIQKTASVGPGGQGGEAAHTLSEAEMPAHSHSRIFTNTEDYSVGIGEGVDGHYYRMSSSVSSDTINQELHTGDAGDSQSHNNMPPFLSVYLWKRTA